MRISRLVLLSACGWLSFSSCLNSNAALARQRAAEASSSQRPNATIVVTPEQAATPKSPTLADFAWLTGRWEGSIAFAGYDKPLTAEQEWMSAKNGTVLGMFRLSSDQKTVFLEFFTIRETPDGILFYFRHFSPELVPMEKEDAYRLKLVKSEGGRFQFDNTVQNQLKDATLTLVDSDHFVSHANLTGPDGKPAAIEVSYHRVK